MSLGPQDLTDLAKALCQQRNCSLVRELGAGAHKRAYLIERDGARYALKIAPITPSLKPRFEREAAALSGCSHPAIAVLHETYAIASGNQEFWISVEEYLAGGTLSERLAAGPVEHSVIRNIALSLADALDHLRSRNLVHRDIKPANILFRTSDRAVLTDFGIVRMLDASSLTQDFLPQGPGTPLYASAEQLLNEKELIDWRTDQFGLALVVAEGALGHHPFTPEGDAMLAIARVARREPLPAQSRERLTEGGFAALIKALAPWPAQRHRFPRDFIAALSGA
jgi:serine/threonine protein kinase